MREVAPHLHPVAERQVLNELMRMEGDAFPPLKGADDLLVVGDAPAGVAAGKAAGCTVIGITTTHEAAGLLDADACVSSPAELKPYLSPLLRDGAEHTRRQ